jgi:hypothetical protein
VNRTKQPPVELKDELTERKVLAYPNAPKPTRVRFQVWDNGDLVMTAHIFQTKRCLSSYDHSYITSENAERYMRDFAKICYFAGWFESEKFSRSNN